MKLSANKVCQLLDISAMTLRNWYGWYNDPSIQKPEDTPELPQFKREGVGGKRIWQSEDIPKLKEFQKWIPRGRGGVMGAYNSKSWGVRGKEIRKRQGLDSDD